MSARGRIAVLCGVAGLYATRRLHEAAQRLGWEPSTVDPARVALRATPSPGVFEDGVEVPRPDAMIPRLTGALAPWGRAVVETWATAGVPCPVGAEALARAQDKLATALRLQAAGVPTVPTAALREPWHADEALLGLVPASEGAWVVKLTDGSGGLGVARGEGPASALAIAQLAARAGVALVQPWLRTTPVRDLRVLVAGHEPLAACFREAAPGEFRANFHRGATLRAATRASLPDGAEAIAVAAARALELPFCGVDLLEGPDGVAVLEVNASPGLEGLERATGRDLATPFVARWLAANRGGHSGTGA
jgi:ribosomal protein S6--L-glutamate ligase